MPAETPAIVNLRPSAFIGRQNKVAEIATRASNRRVLRIIPILLCLPALAQGPRIGLIDFYGLHRVTEQKIRQTLGVKEGDFLPRSKGDVEERLDDIPNVVESHLEAVCCDEGKMILYVGLEEEAPFTSTFASPPTARFSYPRTSPKPTSVSSKPPKTLCARTRPPRI